MAGFDRIIGGGTDPQTATNTANIADNTNEITNISKTILFANFDARFRSESGLPSSQSWALTTAGDGAIDLVDDTIFGVDKKSTRFTTTSDTVKASLPISAAFWQNALINGESYSFVLKSEGGSNNIFSGMGFSAANDPRAASSVRSRIGIFIDDDGTYVTLKLGSGAVVTLDGHNGTPLVRLGDYFHGEAVLNKSPDAGLTFGAVDLYANGIYLYSDNVISSNNAVDDVIAILNSSGTGDLVWYVDNFGVTIYEESPIKLLSDSNMLAKTKKIVVPSGRRDYEVILPDGNPSEIGSNFTLLANNIGGHVTFRTEDLNSPQALFNGENEFKIHVDMATVVTFTNIVENGNVYQASFPHYHDIDNINVEISNLQELEALFGVGTYNITRDTSITFTKNIIISGVFDIVADVSLIIQAKSHVNKVEFTNTGTIFNHAPNSVDIDGEIRVTRGKYTFSGVGAKIFNAVVSTIIIDWATLNCDAANIELGNVYSTSIWKIANTSITGFTKGFILDTNLVSMYSNFFQSAFGTTTVFYFNSLGACVISDTYFIIGANESIFYVKPTTTSNIRFTGVGSFLNNGKFFATGSLNQTSKYITVENAGRELSSNTGTAMSIKNNTALTTITGGWDTLDLGTVELGDLNNRFVLIDATTGERRYEGLYPIKISGLVSISAKKAGGAVPHNFRMIKTVVPDTNSFDDVEMTTDIGTTVNTISFTFSGTLYPGDTFRPEVMANSGVTDITVASYSDTID